MGLFWGSQHAESLYEIQTYLNLVHRYLKIESIFDPTLINEKKTFVENLK